MSKKMSGMYIFLCICFLAILLTGIFFGETDSKSFTYTLKDYNGKLAVYINDSETPERILDSDTAALPLNDREKLKKGIGGLSEAELFRLIEDFSG